MTADGPPLHTHTAEGSLPRNSETHDRSPVKTSSPLSNVYRVPDDPRLTRPGYLVTGRLHQQKCCAPPCLQLTLHNRL